jgi:hypothetical protein
VIICENCGWSVATTNYETPGWDRTRYTIHLTAPESVRLTVIAKLSVLLGMRAIEMKQMLHANLPIAGNLSATDVQRLRTVLMSMDVGLSISPPFPWVDEDFG